MNKAVFLLLFTFLTLAEFFLRGWGIYMPLLACWLFYLTVLRGWKTGLWTAIVFGVITDVLGGTPILCGSVGYLLVMLLAEFWLHRVETDSFIAHSIPGALLPLLVYSGPLPFVGWRGVLSFLLQMPPICAFSALLLPFFLFVMDSISEKIGLPLYVDVKLNLRKEDRR